MQNTAAIKETGLEDLVERAKMGDREVLEEIVRRIQDKVYGLAIRMLFIPADAEDAAQEILVKVITHLGTFKGESRFETWVYSIASNHLLTTRKCRAERWELSFEKSRQAIEEGRLEKGGVVLTEAEQNLIVEETKLSCVHFLFLCLSRELRLAVILSEVFGVKADEGAKILGVSKDSFKKRLSRGKKQLLDFLGGQCGLVDTRNPCNCRTLAAYHLKRKHIIPGKLLFVTHPRRNPGGAADDLLQELNQLARAAMLIRGQPEYSAPRVFVESMKNLINSGRFRLLGD